jgi:AraC-like DNA-binding protein
MQHRESNLLEFPFFHSLSASPVVQMNDSGAVDYALAQMVRKFQTSKPDLRLLRAYLDVLLLEAADQHSPSVSSPAATTLKLRKLEQLIEQNFLKLKKPTDYADKMNLATAYLNSICKTNLRITLSELIQSRILLEARRLLVYSELNINEIAAHVGFLDASYFVRWFRKNAGVTPEEFRKSQTGDR